MECTKLDVENKRPEHFWDRYEYSYRKEIFFERATSFTDFCMVHFHRPDIHQHIYGDKTIDLYDEKKLKGLYQEIDELAGRILEEFGDKFDYIIFMSDHGLPDEESHRPKAFYSSNQEIFPQKSEVKITDFFNKALELTGNEE